MKPGETPGNVGLLTNNELSQMPPPLRLAQTQKLSWPERTKGKWWRSRRDPAGRGKQEVRVIFTLLRALPQANLQSRKFPWLCTKPRSLRISGRSREGLQILRRGSMELPTHSSWAAWVSFYKKKEFVGVAAEGGQHPPAPGYVWRD